MGRIIYGESSTTKQMILLHKYYRMLEGCGVKKIDGSKPEAVELVYHANGQDDLLKFEIIYTPPEAEKLGILEINSTKNDLPKSIIDYLARKFPTAEYKNEGKNHRWQGNSIDELLNSRN